MAGAIRPVQPHDVLSLFPHGGEQIMLIMTRKLGQTITIGDEIEVTVVQIQLNQNQVRLGINAPRQVGVYRKELLQEIIRENVRAAASDTAELPVDITLTLSREAAAPDAVIDGEDV